MTERRQTPPPIGLGAKVMLAGFAMVLAFGICELGARVLLPKPPAPFREPQILYQAHPAAGFTQAPNQAGWIEDGWATINSLGLRGPAPEVPKPSGSVRILAVGDSTTFGWGVGDHETYPDGLGQLLREAFPARHPQVVNAGVSAYDLEHDASLIRYLAPTLDPDIVLVGLFWNDLPYEAVSPDGAVQSGGSAAPVIAPPAGASSTPPAPFHMGSQRPSRMNRVLRSSRLLYALRQRYLSAIAPTGAASNQVQWEMALLQGKRSPAIDHAWDAINSTLQEIKSYADAQGFAVGVLIVPIRAQVEGDYPDAAYQTRVQAMAKAQGFFVVDPLPRLRAHAGEHLFIPYDRMHFSAAGNALIAHEAFDALQHRPEFHDAE
jgi:lysophospholipase L1-like esterase